MQEKLRGSSGFAVNAYSFLKADGKIVSRSPSGFKSPTGNSGSQITLPGKLPRMLENNNKDFGKNPGENFLSKPRSGNGFSPKLN